MKIRHLVLTLLLLVALVAAAPVLASTPTSEAGATAGHPAVATVAGRWQTPAPRQVSLASAADPDAAHPHATDQAAAVQRLTSSRWDVDTVAQAASTCDGCTADATAMHAVGARVTRVGGADNAAAAWASCTGCRATAVSLQVILTQRASTVRAANRALAVTAACTDCHASAAAYQFVVVGGPGDVLTPTSRRHVEQTIAQMAALLARLAPPTGSSARTAPMAGDKAAGQAAEQQLDGLAATLRQQLVAGQSATSARVASDVQTR